MAYPACAAYHRVRMGNEPSRAQPLNVITPVHRVWSWWLRFSWPGAERVWPLNAYIKRPLKNMRFIHFAHWGLMTRMPPQGGKRLPFPYIVFHTNYNGDLGAYVDAFAFLIPWRVRGLWYGSYDFPGPDPMGPFRRWLGVYTSPTLHYYSAYPEASVKMILAGLTLQEEVDVLVRTALDHGDDDAQFAARWERFVAEHGNLL